MFSLIFISLLFAAGDNNADAGASHMVKECHPHNTDYCISLSKGNITAEAGLCVVIPCSFIAPASFEAKDTLWFKCEQNKELCRQTKIFSTKTADTVASGFEGRVSLLEPNVTKKNCSIIINNLSRTDSGLYQFRVEQIPTHGFSYTSKTTLSVTDLKQKPSLNIPELTEGQLSTLSCTAPGLCSGSAPDITWIFRAAGKNDSYIPGNLTELKMGNLSAVHSSSLRFTPSAEHHRTKITCKVTFRNNITTETAMNLKVKHVKEPKMIGNRTVKEGAALNLTCRVKSFPPSVITWNKLDSNQALSNGSGSASLFIPNMTAEHSGNYICKAYHQLLNSTAQTTVNMAFSPRILNRSACEVKAEVLTCSCVSDGFPLPTITWPLIKNLTKYCVSNRVSRNTVWTNFTLTVKDRSYTTVVCVSRNDIGEATRELTVITANGSKNVSQPESPPTSIWTNVKTTELIIGFLIGVILTGTICFLGKNCPREKHNSSGNGENLEMMTTNTSSQVNACPRMENETCNHGGATGGAPGCSIGSGEIFYSEIDFSLLKNRSPSQATGNRESTNTEYAEIKTKKVEERQENVGEEDGMLEENKEEEVMMADEQKDRVSEREEEGEVALYSNLKDLMGEI